MSEMSRPLRILLSNDDSIHATGFGALERIARSLSDDVWVCAPEVEQSGSSHSLTIHQPLRLRRLGEKRWAVAGTPTDSVLLAINHLMRDCRPDLVLSGVNHGRNIAEDVTYSGTIAAAMEATLLGVRAIALSQELPEDGPPDWRTAEHWGPEVIRRVIGLDWPKTVLLNVNFPAVEPEGVRGIAVVPHGSGKIGDELTERIDPRGRAYFWIGLVRSSGSAGTTETDVEVLRDGRISITPLNLDLTHYAMIDVLRRSFP